MFTHHGWAVVDVETTGYAPDTCRVLSVAVLALTAAGRVEDAFSTLVDPGVDPGPVAIHGLTTELLSGAPQFDDITTDLSGLLQDRILVAHNAAFDYQFLAAEFVRAGRTIPVHTRLCTVELAAQLDLGVGNLKLSTLADHFGITQQRPHDALDDAAVLARVFTRLLTHSRAAGVKLPLRTAAEPAARHPLPLSG